MLDTVKPMGKENESLRVAVVGAGAIGGIVAAFLARAGWDLEVVCKHQETVDRALSEGFHIFGVQGEHRIPLRGVKEMHDLSGPKEVVFLATKANDAMEAARVLLPFLKENSVVVSLQNGICEEALAEILGRNRVIGCVVVWGASMQEPGELEITSGGEFVIGFKYRRIKSSSLQSLERGRKTEVEYLNGYTCAQGRQHGVPTPINDAVVRMIKEIEGGQRKMTSENFKNPVFANL
jgi:ketopantoate reductase